MQKQKLMLKIIGAKESISTFVITSDAGGVWLSDPEVAAEFCQLGENETFPLVLGKTPAVFVPFHRIEWMMVKELAFQS
jgi:hypothetical protein